jgi:hypothetical protein
MAAEVSDEVVLRQSVVCFVASVAQQQSSGCLVGSGASAVEFDEGMGPLPVVVEVSLVARSVQVLRPPQPLWVMHSVVGIPRSVTARFNRVTTEV